MNDIAGDTFPSRRSIRLKGYDYAGAGAYFVTLCTWDRQCLFGDVSDGQVRLNLLGLTVTEEWLRTAELREGVETDALVVMPSHIHGILFIPDRKSVSLCVPKNEICVVQHTPDGSWRYPSRRLGMIVRGFKSASTRRINEMRNTPDARVWQRNYHEHVIRGEHGLHRLRQYITENPSRWGDDDQHPSRVKRATYPGL